MSDKNRSDSVLIQVIVVAVMAHITRTFPEATVQPHSNPPRQARGHHHHPHRFSLMYAFRFAASQLKTAVCVAGHEDQRI